MTLVYVFSAIAIFAALLAAIYQGARRVTLALWVCGMCLGAIFLSFGAEVLAVVQWIVITLIGISLLFFSSMFGELGGFKKRSGFDLVQAAMIGITSIAILGMSFLKFQPVIPSSPQNGQDLQSLGQLLSEKHFISLEVLAVTLLLVLVGGGVLARPEPEGEESR